MNKDPIDFYNRVIQTQKAEPSHDTEKAIRTLEAASRVMKKETIVQALQKEEAKAYGRI